MDEAKIIKKANDILNSPFSKIKEFYPYVSEVFIEPLGGISCSRGNDVLQPSKCEFLNCVFHIHLTIPFSEFYKEFIMLYKLKHFKYKIMSPVYEFVFEKYQIDIAFLIDYYVHGMLKQNNIYFYSKYKVNIYSSDGKEIGVIDKVFPK